MRSFQKVAFCQILEIGEKELGQQYICVDNLSYLTYIADIYLRAFNLNKLNIRLLPEVLEYETIKVEVYNVNV